MTETEEAGPWTRAIEQMSSGNARKAAIQNAVKTLQPYKTDETVRRALSILSKAP